MYKAAYTESADLFDMFKFENGTNLFDDGEPTKEPIDDKKRARNGRKEHTNMRHVWTDEEIKKLLFVYAKQHGHIGI